MVFRGDILGSLGGLGNQLSSITSSLPSGFGNLAGNFSSSSLGNLGSVAQVFGQVSSIGNAFSGFEDLLGQFGRHCIQWI
jgi:hypothetical protein